jgi:hypothetical protein
MLLAGKPGMRLLRHYCVLLLPLVCVSVCDLLVSCMAWQGFALQACMHTGWRAVRPVRLAYQPPASSTFLSKQTSQQQPANSSFLSEQTRAWHAAFAALLRTAAASGLCFCVSFAGVVHGVARICVASLHAYWMASCAPSSLGLSATSQQYFSLKTN